MRGLILLLTALLLNGCTTVANSRLQMDRQYIVEWIGERPLIDRSHLSLQLDASLQRAHGFAGCNHWFADFQKDGEHLHLQRFATTKKLCAPALMEQERRYLAALAAIERWDFSELGQLQLWPAMGAPLRLWPDF